MQNLEICQFDKISTSKVNLAFLPTPIHKMKNLTNLFRKKNENSPNLFIKRDDMTGLAMGGNKTRKLEFLLGNAIENKATTIITMGCPQSNHCRQTAAACRLFNLECHLFLIDDNTGEINSDKPTGNILLNNLLGAEIHLNENEIIAKEKINLLMKEIEKQGKIPYFIPPGGTNEIGLFGYIGAFKEIIEDEKKLNVKFDHIVFASSSYGTQCGFILGNKIFKGENQQGKPKKIHGVSVCKLFLDSTSQIDDNEKMLNLMGNFCKKHGLDFELKSDDIIYDQRFNKSGYAVLSEEDKKGIDVFAKNEAIILDPVYSGRAAGGLIEMLENNEFNKDDNVLFIHTGGYPALFTNLFK